MSTLFKLSDERNSQIEKQIDYFWPIPGACIGYSIATIQNSTWDHYLPLLIIAIGAWSLSYIANRLCLEQANRYRRYRLTMRSSNGHLPIGLRQLNQRIWNYNFCKSWCMAFGAVAFLLWLAAHVAQNTDAQHKSLIENVKKNS